MPPKNTLAPDKGKLSLPLTSPEILNCAFKMDVEDKIDKMYIIKIFIKKSFLLKYCSKNDRNISTLMLGYCYKSNRILWYYN